jgi:hypothetical protein
MEQTQCRHNQYCMSLGQVFIEHQGFARSFSRFAASFQRRNVARTPRAAVASAKPA